MCFRWAKTVGIIVALVGLILIVTIMPFWCWILLLGIVFVILGLLIVQLSCK